MISIFMPAYQAETLVEATVARIPSAFWERIHTLHILNDGSTDKTAVVAARLALANAKIRVNHSAQNCGYGATVRKGLQLCLEDGSETIVCLHADGQYAPELLPQLVDYLLDSRLDIVQGSRLAQAGALAGGMPFYKLVAGRILVAIENKVFGLRLTDYHSGYLLYRRRFVSRVPFAKLQGRFEMDLELICLARARGFLVGEMAIPTRYAGETSHLNPVAYGLRVLAVLWRYKRGFYHL